MIELGSSYVVHHLENAEMPPELQHDLMNFSFDKLQDVLNNYRKQNAPEHCNICYFAPTFLECLKQLVCHHFCSSALQILTHPQFSDSAIL
jgi:hypothetical protein